MVTSCSKRSYGSSEATPREGLIEPASGAAYGDSSDDAPPEKKFCDLILAEIWLELDDAIAKNGGSSYGIFRKTFKKHQQKFRWLTRDYLNNYRKQATKELKLPPRQITMQPNSSQVFSAVTFSEELENGARVDAEEEQTVPLLDSEESDSLRNVGGRPKGTTNKALRDLKFRRSAALNWAAVEFHKAKEAKGETKWGKQVDIVREANKKFGLPEKIGSQKKQCAQD